MAVMVALALAGATALTTWPVVGSDAPLTRPNIETTQMDVSPTPPVQPFQLSEPAPQRGDYQAHGVNFSQLVSNQEFSDSTAIDAQQLQNFLDERNSFLADYEIKGQSAASLVVEIALQERINPWILVTTLEKENSLVSRQRTPGESVLGAAMGYGHTDTGKRTGSNNNLEKQLRRGARLLKKLYQEGLEQKFPQTLRVDFGKRNIPIRNAATYALMRYTPHTVDTSLRKVGGGNYLFRNVLEDFVISAASLESGHSATD